MRVKLREWVMVLWRAWAAVYESLGRAIVMPLIGVVTFFIAADRYLYGHTGDSLIVLATGAGLLIVLRASYLVAAGKSRAYAEPLDAEAAHPVCGACGYDLRGGSSTCPECGALNELGHEAKM